MTTRTSRRAEPLSAEQSPNGNGPEPVALSHVAGEMLPSDATRRQQRFADGLRALKVGGGTLKLGERTLMVIGGILAPMGVIVVLLGWWGASETPYVFEQVPYLISGGLLGVGLIFLGAFFYFTHWLTELVKEHRVQSSAIVEALQRLQDEVTTLGAGRVGHDVDRVASTDGAAALVATARGTMSHRADCVVVAGKPDLRAVTSDDGLQPCKLCGADQAKT